MEWEDLKEKYAAIEISHVIENECDAVVVLLGSKLENPPSETPNFTHNWVNFEVGVAAGCHKPAWVLEDYEKFFKFPIPYVTDYAKYNPRNPEHIRSIGLLFEDLFLEKEHQLLPAKIKCPHCHAKYNYWLSRQYEDKLTINIKCPICRIAIENKNFAEVVRMFQFLSHTSLLL